MYKHMSSSIKETTEKQFVSEAEKNRWNSKSEFDGSYNSLKDKPSMIYIGNKEPEDKSCLWIDNSDETTSGDYSDKLVDELKNKLKEQDKIIEKLSYALKYELDPGYFKGIYPGTDETKAKREDLSPNGPNGTIGRIIVKRGYKKDIADLQEGEFGFCIDTEELYIGNKGGLRLLAKVGGIAGGTGSGGNLTSDYVELVAPSGKKYRLHINDDAEITLSDTQSYLANDPATGDSGNFKGLTINKAYIGGGESVDYSKNPCSHNFIELYNSTPNEMNLKGLSLQYGTQLQGWVSLPLVGVIKPYSSFLIRGKQIADMYSFTTRYKIKHFDMSWDIPMTNKGFKFYIKIGIEPCKVKNPFNSNGLGQKEEGYIDLFAVGGENQYEDIDACEKDYLPLANNYRMLLRRTSKKITSIFADTDDNSKDITFVDLREVEPEVYLPRHSAYGQWNYYFDKIKLNECAPNMINICFGQDGNTSRTFTWQSQVTRRGFLKYKKVGETEWKVVETKRQFISHTDRDVTIHSAIVHNLEPGCTYVYKAGDEGMWSDEYTLEIKDRTKKENETYKILWTTDQQAWDEIGYSAWGKCYDYIKRTEKDYDWMLNTGDISQNANRSFEWRYYFHYAKNSLNNLVHMTCCGNNDLIDKKDPLAFTYYTTVENPCLDEKGKLVPSCYSFNYGNVHYICLNSNIIKGYCDVNPQIDFIVNDIKKPENQKRWLIVYIHEAPYSVRCNTVTQPFINLLYDIGVDVVLAGHHHCYARCNRMGRLGQKDPNNKYAQFVIDNENGVYYVTEQATGCKIIGKTTPQIEAPFLKGGLLVREDKPCYGMITITHDKITIVSHQLRNVYPVEECLDKEVEPHLIDTIEILHKEKHYDKLNNLNAKDYKI